MFWNVLRFHHRNDLCTCLDRHTSQMERLTQMTHTILRLTESDASILRDIIRDWLSQFKDEYPNFIVQSAQQILDSLDNPDRKTIEEVYHSIKVDYDKVGETYSSD